MVFWAQVVVGIGLFVLGLWLADTRKRTTHTGETHEH